jgi:hypothetical protein
VSGGRDCARAEAVEAVVWECRCLGVMLLQAEIVGARLHGFAPATDGVTGAVGRESCVLRSHWSCSLRWCIPRMQPVIRRCSVASCGVRVGVVILWAVSVCLRRRRPVPTVGVLELEIGVQTHVVLWNAKTSGVVRNDGMFEVPRAGVFFTTWEAGLILGAGGRLGRGWAGKHDTFRAGPGETRRLIVRFSNKRSGFAAAMI